MLLRLAWWGFNIYAAKKTIDAMKENVELKQTNKEQQTTIRTLASQVSQVPGSQTLPDLPETSLQADTVRDLSQAD